MEGGKREGSRYTDISGAAARTRKGLGGKEIYIEKRKNRFTNIEKG